MRAVWRTVVLLAMLSIVGFTASDATTLRTNTANALVPLDEIISGGPPPDGIPAIDRPAFVSASAASAWLHPKEPVLALRVKDDARAYPLQILMWHEIVNDVVGGIPVTVTYCPLCNSGIVFERTIDGAVLDFGTSGMLYNSDLVMYDRQTHSLWAQMEGRAIVGDRAGDRLALRPANTIAFEDWLAAHPEGRVLSRDTGHVRRYGMNPYEHYDQPALRPFLFSGQPDQRRPPKERVVGVTVDGAHRAYPWPVLEARRVAHDAVGGEPIVVFFVPGTLSALDHSEIARSRAIGSTAVFSTRLESRTLTFEPSGDAFRDRETGTRWSFFGRGLQGPLAGRQLRAVPHVDAFWFAWAAFNPATTIYEPDERR